MKFEYDEQKSIANKQKHGIDFEEAKQLWSDPYALQIESNQDVDERRFLVLAKIGVKNYSAIITYRKDNIRIISVRRSRRKETLFYESYTNR